MRELIGRNKIVNVVYVMNRDETIKHLSECSKLAQKVYKTRHDWLGMVIHWELCKKFRSNHTNKWYMHHLESVLENEMHKLLWKTNRSLNLGQTTRPSDSKQKKKKKKENLPICGLCHPVPTDHKVKSKESEIITSTLPGNWMNNGTWKCRWYQL